MKKQVLLSALLMLSMASFAINWDNYAWLANGTGNDAYTAKYKVAAAFGQTVVNIQHPGFAAEDGIYTNFPAAIESCDLPAGGYVIEGAGMVLYLTAFTNKETAVTVVAGTVPYEFTVYYADGEGTISGGEEEQGGGQQQEGDLTPATFYGTAEAEILSNTVHFQWSVTRNANSTLTFNLTWDSDIEGVVPQICISDTYATMPCENRQALLTTAATYTDGTALNAFFWIAYPGNAARIDIVYTVGASNAQPSTPGEEQGFIPASSTPKAHKVILNGQIYVIKNGMRYNVLGTEIK